MRTLILILVTSLTVLGADGNRFIKTFHYSTNLCLVVSEGKTEWLGQGSYTIRLHELTDNKQLPAGEFYSGLVRPRDGTLENVFFIDVDGVMRKRT